MPQPQGGETNLYKVPQEKTKNAMAASNDAEQAQFQARHTSIIMLL